MSEIQVHQPRGFPRTWLGLGRKGDPRADLFTATHRQDKVPGDVHQLRASNKRKDYVAVF